MKSIPSGYLGEMWSLDLMGVKYFTQELKGIEGFSLTTPFLQIQNGEKEF